MAEDTPERRPPLFDQCVIALVQSNLLSANTISEMANLIRENGGEVLEPNRKGQLRIHEATHIISNTIDFEEYNEATAMMIPVVNASWFRSTLHRNKVAQVRPYSPDPRMIFSSVNLTCADIPDTDKESIIGATLALGGMESKDLTRLTTHICALSMDHPKCVEAQKRGLKCKIVLPHWFDDCFRLGKRIDEAPYLLPDPEILRKGADEDVVIPSSQHLAGATSAVPQMAMPEKSSGRPKLVVFSQKKVMLSTDLNINNRLRKMLADLIMGGDGEVTDSVDECNMFICHYRDGPQYIRAAQAGKDVGNLAWLYHLIVHNQWTSPTRRLLHYPIPRDGIPGFENLKITLSNYGGDARIYLENLITAAGATYTKTMKADNTHLITARMHSEKCEAAKDWNIEIVNHLWIEESYAMGEVQPLTNDKYKHFPPRTNLGEVIGQTFFDERRLAELYYPGGEDKLDATAKKKRKIKEAAQANVYAVETADRNFDVMKDSSPAAAKANKQSKATKVTARNIVTPAKSRHVASGKENTTPSVASTGSRSAKAAAMSKLHNLAPDIALYEKEKKRTKDGTGPWGGKRAADQIDRERAARSSSPAARRGDPDEDDQEAEEEERTSRRPAKRAKMSLPDVEMRICLTGFKRWVGDKHKEDADKKKLRSMGIQLVQETQPCEYLAAPYMVRTMKFLRCLARGPEVISSDFIEACLETGKLQDPADFILKDKENEKRYGVGIDTIVSRARANRGRLLWGVPVYCTADINNGVDCYQAIAEANGAIFKVYRARSGTTIKPTKPEEDGNAPPEPVYLLTSQSAAEKALWPKFEDMARNGNMEPRVVVSDWLLTVAMKQELSFDPKFLARIWFSNNPE
ncbi:hypothetical protein V8F20_012564 [Naviculisporaceae sp. PSN 640]